MIKDQVITDKYSLYNGDCIQGMAALPENSVDMSIYSPPFSSMYVYSSSIYDLGNNKNYSEFLDHYRFVVKELFRITKPGRATCVHCMDIPRSGDIGLVDFPGDIIRMHQEEGFRFWDRKNIWKEPLRVAIRTRQRALMHMELCKDTMKCRGALADYLLIFKKRGENQTPVEKPYGITEYDGDLSLMNQEELAEYQTLKLKYVNHTDDKTNRLSQFIWRRYASASWEDVRANESLCYKPARDKDDDRHVCPIPLDIPNRAVVMYTNPGEVVLTPFMGVGSEVYSAVSKGRKGIGFELKPSYFRQAVKNLQPLMVEENGVEVDLFSMEAIS
jgi:DNA modification methylase